MIALFRSLPTYKQIKSTKKKKKNHYIHGQLLDVAKLNIVQLDIISVTKIGSAITG